ncbi:MAG: integrase [Ideonella sp.]|nr:integrase [Ideonella sp.]
MVINMDETKLRTIQQLQDFVDATPEVKFTNAAGDDDSERYAHISRVLKRFDYPQRNKRSAVWCWPTCATPAATAVPKSPAWWGFGSKNRLAAVPLTKRCSAPAAPFPRKFTADDVSLLVQVDRANEDVCGPAIAHLLRRAFTVYGDPRYERLAGLSVSHLYNLRKSNNYQAQRTHFTKTRPVCNPIGVRNPPRPNGRAGWVRIDSVHQGDLDGVKGVYHITCVDSVSQWQVEACVQGISEAFLLPVLEAVLAQFPFVIEGFHSDNGSSTSITRWPSCWTSCALSRPNHARATATTTPWLRAKTPAWSGSTWATATFPEKYAKPINKFYEGVFNSVAQTLQCPCCTPLRW